MGHAEPGEAISAGPLEPPVKERPVAQEPTVVVAWGVTAYDPAEPSAPPVPPEPLLPLLPVPPASLPDEPYHLTPEPRAAALTIPPEREITRAARQAKLQSRLLTVAALFLLASAGLVVRGALDRPLEPTASASTGRAEPPARPAPESVVTTAATTQAAPAAPEPLAPAEAVAPVTPTPPPVESAAIEELDSVAKPARHPPPARRSRVVKKPRPEIVRESPF